MKFKWIAAVLLCAAAAVSQQQASPQLPAGTTPPTFPQQPDKDVGRNMPPDTKVKAPSSADVQEQIQRKFESEPGLQDVKLRVSVSDTEVVLKGSVTDQEQHTAARRIAASYAGPRKIVDRIQLKP